MSTHRRHSPDSEPLITENVANDTPEIDGDVLAPGLQEDVESDLQRDDACDSAGKQPARKGKGSIFKVHFSPRRPSLVTSDPNDRRR